MYTTIMIDHVKYAGYVDDPKLISWITRNSTSPYYA